MCDKVTESRFSWNKSEMNLRGIGAAAAVVAGIKSMFCLRLMLVGVLLLASIVSTSSPSSHARREADGVTTGAPLPPCPAGSACVPPLRCTTMKTTAAAAMLRQQRVADDDDYWETPKETPTSPVATALERIYQRCRLSAKFEGICCHLQTPENNHVTEMAKRNISLSLHEEIDGGFASGGIVPARKNRKRAISDRDQLIFRDNATLESRDPHRPCRCIIGGPCRDQALRYRRYDGKCNNIVTGQSLWGSAGFPMERILPPVYGNGVWSPRITSITGRYLLSARTISAQLFGDLHVPHHKHNVLMMQFGQFLVHDITRNKVYSETAKCCLEDGSHRLVHPHPACFSIAVSKRDPFYSRFGVHCLEFVRSAVVSRSNCNLGHGRQIASVTHFIDGSGIYGSSPEDARHLRALEGGRLKSLKHRRANNELLPLEKDEKACSSKAEMCFKAGDDRLNQIVTLVAVHTLFLREHNRIAGVLSALNPHWSDEVIYQETRRIVTAELQHIVYNEYLPRVVGPLYVDKYDLYESNGYSHFYDPKVNPSITSEFSAAAFRFGHSTIPDQLELPGGLVDTHKTFFDPSQLRQPHFFDRLFHGITRQPMQKVDDMFARSVTWFLNAKEGFPFGKDLTAINIQRGRDHAVPPYNHYRHLSGRPVAEEFHTFGPVLGPKLAQVYASPEDIDLYVGGILERPVPGGLVGETFAEIIADQFSRLKEGDRYYYSNGPRAGNPGYFTEPQLEALQRVTLAGLLCANANDDTRFEVPPSAFDLPHARENPLSHCHSDIIPKLDLQWWKD